MLAYEETVQKHYESLRRLGLGVDVVSPQAVLSAYRVVVAPELFVIDEAIAVALAAYVESGGTLVLAPRPGVKDRWNSRTVGTPCRSGRLRPGSTSWRDSGWSTT